MKIGFDAYFAFHYKTGVAHYGRNLISSLAENYPEVTLFLFTDVSTALYQPAYENVQIVELGYEVPYHQWLQHSALLSAIHGHDLQVFHGLDHGLPASINCAGVVTVHDLFFETHPALYAAADAAYYREITPASCDAANRIISISAFTAGELQRLYAVDQGRIDVCYQTCNPLFFEPVGEARKQAIRQQFQLPDRFWLYVGSVTERKNLLNICKALTAIKRQSAIPLIVIGEGDAYLNQVQEYVRQQGLETRVQFLSYTAVARASLSFQQARDVPVFHQLALALLYPSLLEGFGIPLVEAFASGLPVLTANTSSLPEVGGDAALYVDPANVDEMATALLRLEQDEALRTTMITRGRQMLQRYTPGAAAAAVMDVYKKLV